MRAARGVLGGADELLHELVATTDWTAGGGDKHYVLKKNGSAFSSMEQMYLEAAADYIRFLKEMGGKAEGRITILR